MSTLYICDKCNNKIKKLCAVSFHIFGRNAWHPFHKDLCEDCLADILDFIKEKK